MKYRFNWTVFKRNFMRDWQLHLLIFFPILHLIIFNVVPMYGVQMAFRDYRPLTGITGSEWVGLKWFEAFLSSHEFKKVFVNTLAISVYSLAMFPLPIIFALILNALKSEKYKGVVQTVSYMPHFISTAIMVGILNMLLSPTSGIYGSFYQLFGGAGYPKDFRFMSETFRHLYIWSDVWQGLGWNSIIYIAALSGVSQELHEAAQIDGATRFKRIWYVDIPAILPTIAIMLIMRCTHIISVGFEKVFLMQNALNLSVSEVISTYTYKKGLESFRTYSYGTAVGLFNTVINLVLLVTVNTIVKKSTDGEISLY